MSEVRVSADPAAEVAGMLVSAAAAGGHIVLTGGSTPRRAYELAAAAGGDWSECTLWFGDERCVEPDHHDSNFRLARESLLDALAPGHRPRVHRMEGERGPQAGAEAYERILRAEFGEAPSFDLLLLGLGPDGHMASLFPGRPEVAEREAWVVGVPEAGMQPWLPRISLTVPAINAARRIVFLVSGEGKADAVARAFGVAEPGLPAALVGDPLVVSDAAAAGRLPA